MCGNSAYAWNTVLTSRLYGGMPCTYSPLMRMKPSSGCSKPASIRSVVVLPQPLTGRAATGTRPACTDEVELIDGDHRAEPLGDVGEFDGTALRPTRAWHRHVCRHTMFPQAARRTPY